MAGDTTPAGHHGSSTSTGTTPPAPARDLEELSPIQKPHKDRLTRTVASLCVGGGRLAVGAAPERGVVARCPLDGRRGGYLAFFRLLFPCRARRRTLRTPNPSENEDAELLRAKVAAHRQSRPRWPLGHRWCPSPGPRCPRRCPIPRRQAGWWPGAPEKWPEGGRWSWPHRGSSREWWPAWPW